MNPLAPLRSALAAMAFTSRVLTVVVTGRIAHLAVSPVSAVRRRATVR